jgi:peptidoglycan/xylan/chitin deacetylase (PgdA/CDA1 family)
MADLKPSPRTRDFVGYGRRPPAVQWPDGARVAVNLVVNYEEGSEHYTRLGDASSDGLGELGALALSPEHRDFAMESLHEYGTRVGIWRLIGILEEYGITATIFACGRALELNPEVGRVIAANGYDICGHGYRWSEPWRFDREQEQAEIRRAVETILATTGVRPAGWYWRYSSTAWSRDLLVEEGGFLYDSESYNDDLPYFVNVGETRRLVIPYSQLYNDVRFVVAEGGFGCPTDFVDYLKRALDELLIEGARGFPKMLNVGVHPRWSGQAARANAFREFIEYALEKGDVWFARRDEIARWWIDHSEEWS